MGYHEKILNTSRYSKEFGSLGSIVLIVACGQGEVFFIIYFRQCIIIILYGVGSNCIAHLLELG